MRNVVRSVLDRVEESKHVVWVVLWSFYSFLGARGIPKSVTFVRSIPREDFD